METRVCVLIERTWMNGDDEDTQIIIGLSRHVVSQSNRLIETIFKCVPSSVAPSLFETGPECRYVTPAFI